jgi:phospholipase C
MRRAGSFLTVALAVFLGNAGCHAGTSPMPPSMAPTGVANPSVPTPIKHIIVVIQENRSFDNLFATFPGADGTKTGFTHDGKLIELYEGDLATHRNPPHGYRSFLIDYDGGKMDGFDLVHFQSGKAAGAWPYRYVNPAQIQPYWSLAKEYVLADHMFQTQGSGSFTAHQDLIAGATRISAQDSLVDFPTSAPWGCDAPRGTVTSLITTDLNLRPGKGPFPCLSYRTIRDLLDAKNVSWKYYSPPGKHPGDGDNWDGFDAIRAVRRGPEWSTNISVPETNVLKDARKGTLPSVAWVIPDAVNSDHPALGSDTGPSWVAQVVNAIGESSAWKSSAIIILWDDWGGFYDHVPPPLPRDDQGGPGFRVPVIIVSPYVPEGRVSHTIYSFGSILKFIENNWDLGRLGTTDQSATSLGKVFDYKQKPRAFTPIESKYSRAYFEHQRPSYLPVDTE